MTDSGKQTSLLRYGTLTNFLSDSRWRENPRFFAKVLENKKAKLTRQPNHLLVAVVILR